MKHKTFLKLMTIIILFASALLIFLYFKSTFNWKLSKDSAVWADFGSFLSPLVSLMTMMLLISTIRFTNKNAENSRQTVEKIERERFYKEKTEQLAELSIELNAVMWDFITKSMKVSVWTSIVRKLRNQIIERKEVISLQTDIAENEKKINIFNDEIEDDYNSIKTIYRKIESLILIYFHNDNGLNILSGPKYCMMLITVFGEIYTGENGKKMLDISEELLRNTLSQIKKLYNAKGIRDNPLLAFDSLLQDIMMDLDKELNLNVLSALKNRFNEDLEES